MIEISELVSAIQQRAQGRYEVCAPQAVDLPAPLAEMEFQTIQIVGL